MRDRLGSNQVLVLLALVACHHYRVVDFDVAPHMACPGDAVQVSWKVEGQARLAIVKGTKTPTADQILAAEQPVKSNDRQTFQIDQTTTFVIRAVDANQAKDPWQGAKWVDVPVSDETKGVTTGCTGATCAGTFTVHASSSAAQVTRISQPMLKQNGTTSPATIRVTHASLAAVELEPGHDITAPVPATGAWTLETTLPASVPTEPPPGLSVTIHIACP